MATSGTSTSDVRVREHLDLWCSQRYDGLPGSFAGWVGECYSSIDLTGTVTVCRDDPQINFDWATGAPAPSVPGDNFSVGWTRTCRWQSARISSRLFRRRRPPVRRRG
jgi:hypothetical protein